MNIVGIDASIAGTGLAFHDRCMTLRPTFGADNIGGRLDELEMLFIRALSLRPKTSFAVMEAYATPNKKRTGETAYRIAELGGIIKKQLFRFGIDYVTIPPNSLKKYATNNGWAQKHEMIHAAKVKGAKVANDNEADAWWLRQVAVDYYRPFDEWEKLEQHQKDLHARMGLPKEVL